MRERGRGKERCKVKRLPPSCPPTVAGVSLPCLTISGPKNAHTNTHKNNPSPAAGAQFLRMIVAALLETHKVAESRTACFFPLKGGLPPRGSQHGVQKLTITAAHTTHLAQLPLSTWEGASGRPLSSPADSGCQLLSVVAGVLAQCRGSVISWGGGGGAPGRRAHGHRNAVNSP